MKGKERKKQSKNPAIQSKHPQPPGVSMDMETSWAAQELKSTYSDLNNMARFQQKQLQEKEQKLLQLYDQQQQRAYQVVQRGSAGSNGSNHATSISQHTTQVTKTSSSSHTTTSTSQGGKVRQMFDERRQTGVKGIDRSYPLEPLENKPRKQANGNSSQKNGNLTVSRQSVTVKRVARADVNSNLNGGKPVVSYHEEITRESFGTSARHLQDDDEFGNENHVADYANGSHRDETRIEEVLDEDTIERNRMMAKLHLMEYDETLKHRVKNDLESEEFPEEFIVDVPDKLPKQNVTKKLSQAEVRLERFKNANAKRNNITRNATTKKRSDPVLPAKSTSSAENAAEARFVFRDGRRLSPEVKPSKEEFPKDRKSPKFFCKESEKSATTYAIDSKTRSKSPAFSREQISTRSESPKFFCKESEKSATTYAIDSGMDAKTTTEVTKDVRKRSGSPKFFCKESEKSATTYAIDSNAGKRLDSDVSRNIKKRSESPKFFRKESEKSATTYAIDTQARSKSPEFSKPKVKKRSESPKFFCKETEKSATTHAIDSNAGKRLDSDVSHNIKKRSESPKFFCKGSEKSATTYSIDPQVNNQRIDSSKFSHFASEKYPVDLKNRASSPDYMKDTESFLLKAEPNYKTRSTKVATESMGIDTVDRFIKQERSSKKISGFSSADDLKSTESNKSSPKLEKLSKTNPSLSESKSPNVSTRLRRERSSSPQFFRRHGNQIRKSPNFDADRGIKSVAKRGKIPPISHRSNSKSPDFTAKSFRKCSSSPQFYASDSERSASVLMVTPETICKPKAESASFKTKNATGNKVRRTSSPLESSREFIRNSVSRFFSEHCERALREADVRNEVQSGENEARLHLSRSCSPASLKDTRLQFYPEGIDDGKVDGSIDGRGEGDRDWSLKLEQPRDERRSASKFHDCETEKCDVNSIGDASKSNARNRRDHLEIETRVGRNGCRKSRKSPEFPCYEREKGTNVKSGGKAAKTKAKNNYARSEAEEKLDDESFARSSPKKREAGLSKGDVSRGKPRSPKLSPSSLKQRETWRNREASTKPRQSRSGPPKSPENSCVSPGSGKLPNRGESGGALRSTKLIRDAMKRQNYAKEAAYVCAKRSKGSRSSSSSSADAGRISIAARAEEDELPARWRSPKSCTSPEMRETRMASNRYIKQEEKVAEGGFSGSANKTDRKSIVEGLFAYSAHKGGKKRGSPFDSSVFEAPGGEKRVSSERIARNTSDSRSCGEKSVISDSRRATEGDETRTQMREGNSAELKEKRADLKQPSIGGKLTCRGSTTGDSKGEIKEDATPTRVQKEAGKPKEGNSGESTDLKSQLVKEKRGNLNRLGGQMKEDATTTRSESLGELKRKKSDLKSRLIGDKLNKERSKHGTRNTWHGNRSSTSESIIRDSKGGLKEDSIYVEDEEKIVNDPSKEEKEKRFASGKRNLKVESFDSRLSKENYGSLKYKTRDVRSGSSSMIKESTWETSENTTENHAAANRKSKGKSFEGGKQTPSPAHSNPKERSITNNSDKKYSDLKRKNRKAEDGASKSTLKATQKGTFRVRRTPSPQNSLKRTQTLKSMELVRRAMQDSSIQTEKGGEKSSKMERFSISAANSTEVDETEYYIEIREKSSSACAIQIEEADSESDLSRGIETPKVNSQLASTKNYERTDSVESALRRFDSIETDPAAESVCNPLSQRSLDQEQGGEPSRKTASETKSSISLRTLREAKVNPTNVNVIESTEGGSSRRGGGKTGRSSPGSGSKSPSCKRRLFNADPPRKSETVSWKSSRGTTVDEKKLRVDAWKRSTSGDEMETIDKGGTSTGADGSFRCVKQLRSIEDIRKSMAEGESCGKSGGSANRRKSWLAKASEGSSRINIDAREGNGEEISLTWRSEDAFGDAKSMMGFTCRLAKSPSPEKATETSSRARRIPASPSKSPDTVARRPSTESKAQDAKSSKRPTPMKGTEAIGNRKTTTSTRKSTDVVDGAILENGLHLRGQTAETKYDNDSPTTTKKSDAFVIDFDEQPPKENDAPLPRKPLLRKQSTEKQIPSTQSVRPPSSVSSTSSGSSMQGQVSGSRGKMASRAKTPISGSTTYKGSSKSGGNVVAADNLVPCKMCGRRFAQDRVTLHEQICAKTGQKKRKTFDTMMYRVRGTDLEPFVKKGLTKKQPERLKKPEVKSNWRRKHEDFINAIRSAKQVQAHLAAGGKLSDLPPPPVSDNCDYIQCPHCGRKFNQAAAERHIPKCEHMLHNKPIHSRAPKPRR